MDCVICIEHVPQQEREHQHCSNCKENLIVHLDCLHAWIDRKSSPSCPLCRGWICDGDENEYTDVWRGIPVEDPHSILESVPRLTRSTPYDMGTALPLIAMRHHAVPITFNPEISLSIQEVWMQRHQIRIQLDFQPLHDTVIGPVE